MEYEVNCKSIRSQPPPPVKLPCPVPTPNRPHEVKGAGETLGALSLRCCAALRTKRYGLLMSHDPSSKETPKERKGRKEVKKGWNRTVQGELKYTSKTKGRDI